MSHFGDGQQRRIVSHTLTAADGQQLDPQTWPYESGAYAGDLRTTAGSGPEVVQIRRYYQPDPDLPDGAPARWEPYAEPVATERLLWA